MITLVPGNGGKPPLIVMPQLNGHQVNDTTLSCG